ncbi:ABC transporter ATP-binding protein [Thorsellia kenyensis]|uniref:ABC transporter ATP-binding protein n=1 Tax=Thorsellia kenyensis TaxID=1549888 RepID=A0ABV6CDC1_9GAMM
MADISIKKLIKRYDKTQTIHGIDLEIKSGEFTVFVGPSGCGKSTLLRMIAGLEEITEGELWIDNQLVNHVDPANRGVAMVFQSYALYPHMTVEENMGFGLKMNGVDKSVIQARVNAAAKTLQMEHLLKRKPKDLSGGQRQRVAIGRAIVREPKVFLFDEPLSNLDAELRVDMRLQIAKLHYELQNTMIYVTHDQVEAMTLADKIVVLRAGNIEQVGSPLDLYHRPINEFVAGFIGSPKMNFIPGVIKSNNYENGDKAYVTVELANKQTIVLPINYLEKVSIGDNVKLGIRPEHIQLFSDDTVVPDTHHTLVFDSEVSERLGSATYLFGRIGDVEGFKVQMNGDHHVGMFQKINVMFALSDCHLFNKEGLRISPNN